MSSEIITSNQTPAPVPWRVVSAVVTTATSRRSSAEQQTVSMLDQARRQAFAEGLAAGRQQAEEQIRPAMEGLARVLAELAQLRAVIREQETEKSRSLGRFDCHPGDSPRSGNRPGRRSLRLVQAAFTKAQAREINRVRMHPRSKGWFANRSNNAARPKNLRWRPIRTEI